MSNEKKKDNKIKDIYSLSPMQEGMLYYSLLDNASNAYFEQSLLSIESSLNIKYLEDSFNKLIERYDILRTVFVHEKVERPVQVVMKARKAHIQFENIEHLTEDDKKKFVEDFKQKDRQRGFNLSKDLLMRISVIKTNRESYKLIWSFHHIIMDGWCMAIIRQEFLEIYNSLEENRTPNLGKVFPYSDYIKWLTRQNREDAALYWQNYLGDYSERALILPNKTISAPGNYKVAEVAFPISDNTKKRLEIIARKNNVTLNTIVQSAWGIVLQRYNNSNDVVFGAVVSGRPHEITGIENMVGLFINTLPVRIKCDNDETFSKVINKVQNVAVESERYSYYPLAEIQAGTSLKGALVDHIVVFENYPVEEALVANNTRITIGGSEAYEQTNYNLNVIIILGKNLTVKFNYNSLVYDESIIKRIGEHFQSVISCIVENPDILVSNIGILTEEERRKLLSGFNNTKADYQKDKTVQELFETAAVRNPENIAVAYGEQRLTYKELNSKANQLARVLRNKGVKSASIVGILAERSPELIIGILGILKAGGTYLPIDPEYPEDRIGYMLKDSSSRVLLTQRHLNGRTGFSGVTIELDDSGLYTDDDSNLSLACNPKNLAYVIYTSGSTGKPKGVEIEQTSLVNLVSWHQRVYNITVLDRATLLAGQAFDASVWEIWPYLTTGAGLYIPKNETRASMTGLIQWLKDNQITISFMPTPMAEALMGEEWPRDMALRVLLTGGDKLHRHPQELPCRLVNHYGPTESTVVATSGVVSPGEVSEALPSIGRPIDNTQIYIVDKNDRLQPVGAPGELCIAGDGLARGYLNQPELTAEKFVDNPFALGEKMYRTGDLARWLPDGNIEFLGRIDHQVKIRGFRIELGEIEAELMKYPAIKEACVIAKDDVADQKYLCAYIVAEEELAANELREYLRHPLPDYMVPSSFVQLEKMPLTPNGKIDRKVLPEPDGRSHVERRYIAPRNEAEEKMAKIWQEVLGVEKVGIEDNFFELGGHSLKAINLVAKIHKAFSAEVSLQELFKAQTIKKVVEIIEGTANVNYAAIEPIANAEYYPVSSAQKRMLILSQFEKNGTAYNIPGAFTVEGGLDKSRLAKALWQLVARHETLRTSFEFIDGEPVQIVHQEIEFTIDSIAGTEDNIQDMVSGFVRPFDLSKAPLFRIGLGEFAENRQILLFDMHHIISDGVSMGILVKELASLYMGQELPELRLQYKDFSAWQEKRHRGEDFKQQEEYWLRTFSGELPVLNLIGDYPRLPVKSFEGERLNFILEGKLTEDLKKFAGQTNTTLYMVLLAAYNVLLSKYAGQEDIVVGSPIAGRTHADVENIIGLFINTVAMRNYPSGDKRFREFLQEVKENALAAYDHQEYQFEELVDKLAIPRDLSRAPLFDTMFVLQNMDIAAMEFDDLKFTPYELDNKTAKFDLTLRAAENNNRLEFTLEYYSKLFKRETVQRLARHFVKVLKSIVEQPECKLAEIELLAEDEKKQILVDFNNTNSAYPADKTINALFEERVAKTPDNIAVKFAEQQLTYQELNTRANQLARVLRNKGVKANRIVGIMVDRSLEMIIGILGILKAGGAYLPIAPEYPAERVSYTLEDSGAEILLTQRYLISAISFNGDILALDDQSLYRGETINLRQENTSHDAAYVIYTSGSTGKPKGVLVEHKAAVNMVSWLQQQYPLGEDDVILQKTPFTFDASGRELLWWIVSQAKLCFLKPGGEKDPAEIYKAIEKNKITVINFVPSALNVFLEYANREENSNSLSSLRKVFVGGEALKLSQVERFNELLNKRFNTKLVNLYGPTEATIDVSCYDCSIKTPLEVIPIGKPINNLVLYIMGRNNTQLLPIGVAGEVCIAGEGLARGYVNRPELTAEKFVENPFILGGRMYRTGDLGRWLPDGNIEYLGRIDHQVKIRGFRIELGEIEAELLKHPSIIETVVIAKEDAFANNYLCAYFVAGEELTTTELREHLAQELPDYMIPSSFVQLANMPLTSSAKIDRKALPEPEGRINTGTEYLAPANEREKKLVALWEEVLGAEKVGMNDNFFDLGGHSIKAIALVNRIYKEFGAEIGLQEVFKAKTVKELSKIIDGMAQNSYAAIQPVQDQAYYPVSSAQKRMFILQQFQNSDTAYNMPAVFTVEGGLDIERLEGALSNLVQRHETLRTSFEVIGGEPVQRIHKEVEFAIDLIPGDAKSLLDITIAFVRPFDLSKAPLLRVGLVELAENKHVVLCDMHHIISDGVSRGNFIRELMSLYEGRRLQELKIQYRDFSAWQNKFRATEAFKRQEEYWLNVFAGELPALNMPTDYLRPAIRSLEGDRLGFTLGEEVTAGLNKIAGQTGTTLYMVLLTAYNILLSKYTGQADIVVGVPIAGRSHADLENIIGMFVNTLAMRNYPEGTKSFKEFLQEVKDNAIAAYDHQAYQFEELVDKLAVTRELNRNPLFDTMFVLEDTDKVAMEVENLNFVPCKFENKISKFDFTLQASERNNCLEFVFEYYSKLFKKETVERMGRHFISILQCIIKQPQIKLAEIEILSEAEKKQILSGFNNTKADYQKDKTVQELFETAAVRNPENIAVAYGEQRLTYKELNSKANQLARVLRNKGVKSASTVGILAERSPELIIGILGILKAGGTYLPIDPEYPADRIGYMLKDSSSRVLLTQRHLNGRTGFSGVTIELDDSGLYTDDDSNLSLNCNPKELAYVIYTSGSTGKPKGVEIEQTSLVNLVSWHQRVYNITVLDRATILAGQAFDASVWEIWPYLTTGAGLYIPKNETRASMTGLIKWLKDNQITISFMPTPMAEALMGEEWPRDMALRVLLTGGDKLHRRPQELPCRLVNHYGPTESTVVATSGVVSPGEVSEALPSIGRPIDNTQIYIVDKNDRLQPVGVPGELCIAGDGLARGYLNQPELTAEKFVDNPFALGEKMYRTGDLARWLPDGNIEFLGRIDHQVKIRGFRIELGEIEAELMKYPAIKEACVIAKDDVADQKYLCAYIVAEEELDVNELREYLRHPLPDYMVPSSFVQLEKMPLTPNGKIDRKVLPEPDGRGHVERMYIAPRNEAEEKMAKIWQEVLGVEKVGIEDNFFELGGHSLKVITLIAKVREEFCLDVIYEQIFKTPNIKEFTTCILQGDKVGIYNNYIKYNANDNNGCNLFFFPPAVPLGLIYRHLAGYLADYTLFCFNLIETEDKIRDYVKSIIAVQPQGPYILVGFSAGGTLTYEVARELEKQGYQAEIILLDCQYVEISLEVMDALMKQFDAYLTNMEISSQEKGNIAQFMQSKTADYLKYLNTLLNKEKIMANIYHIYSSNKQDMSKVNEWAQKTTGKFLKYEGFGAHESMLEPRYVEENAKIMQEILQRISIPSNC